MTKAKEAKMVKAYKEFLKVSPMVWKENPYMKGYKCISEADMMKKDEEFLKHIGYEGDEADFYWEYGVSLVSIRLQAIDR